MNQAAAEEPFGALFDVVGIGVADWVLRNGLLRSLRMNDRNCGATNQNEYQNSQRKNTTPTWHDDSHLPVSGGDASEATLKRYKRLSVAHFGKSCFRSIGATGMRRTCTICFPWLISMEVAELKSFCMLFAACLALSTASGRAQKKESAAELVVAAAADLSTALQEIGDSYEKKTGVKVKLSFGASGALTQQIQNGAPFDLFFSADMDYPRQLVAAGDADGASLYQYAVGKLVLWVPADSSLDVEHQGMNILLDPAVKKIAIANPQHAPYGRAAAAALKHAGLYDRIADRLVLGENVSQAAQFVESGNAQAGFVALAHAVAPAMRGKGKYWEVPVEFYPPLAQGAVVLSHSQHKKEAADFLEYIKTKESADLLRKYGFTLP